MAKDPDPRDYPPGCALQWMPLERLDEGIEAREVRSNGRPAGLVVQAFREPPRKTVLLGPIEQVLREPQAWLDGLEFDSAVERVNAAIQKVPPDRLEEALAAWEGSDIPPEP